jgi:hypothetical protein
MDKTLAGRFPADCWSEAEIPLTGLQGRLQKPCVGKMLLWARQHVFIPIDRGVIKNGRTSRDHGPSTEGDG